MFFYFTFNFIFSIMVIMKRILIKLIKVYQAIPGPWHRACRHIPGPWHGACRHIPTCSNYALEAIETYGSFKGSKMAIKRVLKCNPWGTCGYDPVIKEDKND